MTLTFAPRPPIAPALDYTFPAADQWTLDNGLRVLHIPSPGKLVNLVLVTEGGALLDPAGQEGLARLVTRLRCEGTRNLDGRQFAAALDAIGASLSPMTSYETCVMSMQVPADHLPPAVDLLAQTATGPVFAAADVEQQRDLQLNRLQQALSYPGQRAYIEFASVCYADTQRWSIPEIGTTTTIPDLDDEAVQRFAADHLRPDHSTLIVTGDCRRDVLDHALATCFAGWSAGSAPTSDAAGVVGVAGTVPGTGDPGVHIVDIPGAVQTEIRLGGLTAGRHDPAWAGLSVAAHVLGGPLDSRLSSVLREEKGYTYGVFAYVAPVGRSGEFLISTAVDTASTGPALNDLIRILGDAGRDGITTAEVRAATGEFLSRDGLKFQTAHAVAGELLGCIEHGLPPDWRNAERTALADVTVAAASRDLAELALLAHPHVVLAGDAERIGGAVAQAFPDVSVTTVPSSTATY